MDQALLNRIVLLKNKAEGAKTIGEMHEAQTFMIKVQELLLKNNLTINDVEYVDIKEHDIVKNTVNLRKEGLHRKRRIAWMEDLATVVAVAHYCKLLVTTSSTTTHFVGTKENAEVAGYVWLYLVRMVETVSEAEYCKFYYKCEDRGDVTEARGFKESFRAGFLETIAIILGRQMEQAQTEIESKHVGMTMTPSGDLKCEALVRIDHMMEKIDEFIEEESKGKAERLNDEYESGNDVGYRVGVDTAHSTNIAKGVSAGAHYLLTDTV